MALWLTLGWQVAQVVAAAEPPPRTRRFAPMSLIARHACEPVSLDREVVVCGGPAERYRLPLRAERSASAEPSSAGPVTGMAALTPPARCGIFTGERPCGKRELTLYGYGKDRDPVRVLAKLAAGIADPD